MSGHDQTFFEEYDRVNARVISESELVVHIDLVYVDTYRAGEVYVEEQCLEDLDSLGLQKEAMEESRALGGSSLRIKRLL